MIKLFAMDLDGTILDNNSKLDKKIIEGLRKLDENGIKFVFTSARAKPSVDYLSSLTGIKNPTIANNGAIISLDSENIIYENSLTYSDVKKLIRFCDKNMLFYQFYDFNTYYSNRIVPERFEHLKRKSDYGMNYQVNFSFSVDPLNEIIKKNTHALKFQIFPKGGDPLLKEEIINEVKNLNKNLYITSSNNKAIEIMQKNVSKFEAICELSQYLGISLDEIAAIGDQNNDIPMLKSAKLSFAVANAIESVKKISDIIVEANYDFGLLKAIDIVIERNKKCLI